MDFYGQRLAERIYQVIIVSGFIVGIGYGWHRGNLLEALYGWLGGLFIAILLCAPSWPWFKRNPIKWLPIPKHIESTINDSDTSDDEQVKEEEKGSSSGLLKKKSKSDSQSKLKHRK